MNTYYKIGSNQRERNTRIIDREIAGVHRVDILYSYDIPVAAFDRAEQKLYITTTHHSSTTTRHINKWTQRFSSTERFVMSQESLWELHHKCNLWEAEQAGVTA